MFCLLFHISFSFIHHASIVILFCFLPFLLVVCRHIPFLPKFNCADPHIWHGFSSSVLLSALVCILVNGVRKVAPGCSASYLSTPPAPAWALFSTALFMLLLMARAWYSTLLEGGFMSFTSASFKSQRALVWFISTKWTVDIYFMAAKHILDQHTRIAIFLYVAWPLGQDGGVWRPRTGRGHWLISADGVQLSLVSKSSGSQQRDESLLYLGCFLTSFV